MAHLTYGAKRAFVSMMQMINIVPEEHPLQQLHRRAAYDEASSIRYWNNYAESGK